MAPSDEARLFALDALRAARASWSRPTDEGTAAMSVFVVLAAEALFPDVLADPAAEPYDWCLATTEVTIKAPAPGAVP